MVSVPERVTGYHKSAKDHSGGKPANLKTEISEVVLFTPAAEPILD
jgi:hypothetical protein